MLKYLIASGIAVCACLDCWTFEKIAFVDGSDYPHVFDIENAAGTERIIDRVLETGADVVLWRTHSGAMPRYASGQEDLDRMVWPIDKRRASRSTLVNGWVTLWGNRPDQLKVVRELCAKRPQVRKWGLHMLLEEAHWQFMYLGAWNLEHPQFWCRKHDGTAQMYHSSFAYPEVLKHRLTIDKTVETYLPEADSMFADIQGNEEAKKIYASELRTQPVKPYVMRQEEAPYLLELAIRATVVGELADFAAFASDLQKENRCYSLTNFEMQTIKPVLKNERKAQLISSQEDSKRVHLEKVRVTFVCTGFVKPEVDKMQEELEKLKKPSEKAPRNPAGNDSEETEKPLGI